ncbi:TonB-dependent receptor [Paraflavisolibacter sp. H34]|uniref:SusC/RagA family TonB-linked outer membrane protein n=1 Tax=Huijunlia imazamoxiresistens TaxID=3127457 RepID=UPI00301B5A18
MLTIASGRTSSSRRWAASFAKVPGYAQAISRTFMLALLLNAACTSVSAQSAPAVRLTGKVVQPSGEPLVGATISEKGSTKSVTTQPDGTFTLDVSRKDAMLSISYVGYTALDRKATGDGALTITLQPATGSMDEVVVIGYGTSKRKDLTGSVASVSGKQIAATPVANAAQALQGKMPGVNVTTQDGRPDAGVSIRVRGGGSISQTNDPLFIVDGFPVSSINDIPPTQIESIDVLKDAASTAIYGARGANGVIIVTTKSGKSGKLTVAYDNYIQYNKPTKYLETMNAYDYVSYNWAYAKAISDSYAGAWERLWGIGSYAATYNNADGINHYKNVEAKNYSRDAYGPSYSHNHNLTISNGNAKTKYLLALNYTDNDGMKINSWFKRANVAFKLDQKLTEKLSLSLDTRYTDIRKMSDEGTTTGRGSILSSAYLFRPIARQDVLGELDDTKNTQLGLYDVVLQDRYNPVERMKDYQPWVNQQSMRANTALTWTIIKGLSARSELGLNRYWHRNKTWSGAVYNDYLDNAGNKTFSGNASISSDAGWSLRWVNTLNYQVTGLGEDHSLSMTAGQELMNSYGEGINMYGNRYPVSFDSERAFAMMNQYLTGTNPINFGIGSSVSPAVRLNSLFGRLNYSLMDKYLVSGTFRADASSKFSSNHRRGYFPAGAVAWRMSNEDFLKDVRWLDNLKLRASYGAVGNDAIDATQWKAQWSSSGLTRFSTGEQQQASYVPGSIMPNPDLIWETTVTRNLGLDFSFFKRRLYGTLDVYQNSSKNLLMKAKISPTTGFDYQFQNVSSTSNRGVELSLGSDLIHTKDFTLTANVNVNVNRGRIDELSPGVTGLYKTGWGSSGQQPNTGDYILEVGKPVGQVRGFVYDGWYTTADFTYANGVYTLKKGVADIGSGIIGTVYGTTANKPGGQVAYPGVVKFKDRNNDGVIDDKDATVIGDMNPKHTGGLSVNATYKSFDLALNFNWVYGNQIYNANYLAAFYGSKEDGLYRNRLNYLSTAYKIFDVQNGQIQKVLDPAALDALNAGATTFLPYHENPVVSTMGIQDGSFLRLNTVTLGYNLPEGVVKKMRINRLRVYGAIYNALTFTNYPGLDPEVNTNMNQGGTGYPTPGLDWGAYPRARSFTAGLNIEF